MATGDGGDGPADGWFVPASDLAWQSIVSVSVCAAATSVQFGVMIQAARSLRRYLQFSSVPALSASRGSEDRVMQQNLARSGVKLTHMLTNNTDRSAFSNTQGQGADAAIVPSIALLSQKFDASTPRSTALRGGRQHGRVALALRLTWFLASFTAFLGATVNVFTVVTRADYDERLVVHHDEHDVASGFFLAHREAPSAAGRFCQVGTQIGVASYGLSKFWSFMFFFFKARAVRPQLAWSILEKCVFVASLGILPFAAVGVAWSAGDQSSIDGSCVLYIPRYMILTEGVLDVILSSSFLWLFVAPLYATLEGTTLFRSSANGTTSASASKASVSVRPAPLTAAAAHHRAPSNAHHRSPSGALISGTTSLHSPKATQAPLFGAQSVKLARRSTLVTSRTDAPMIELAAAAPAAAAPPAADSQPTTDLVQQFVDSDAQSPRRTLPMLQLPESLPDQRVVLLLATPSAIQAPLSARHAPSSSLENLPQVFLPQSSVDSLPSPSKPHPHSQPQPSPSPRRASVSLSQAGGGGGGGGSNGTGPQAQFAASLTVFSAASRDKELRALIRKNIFAFVGTVLTTIVMLSLMIVALWTNDRTLRKFSNAVASVEIAVMLSALLVLMQRNSRAQCPRRRGVADGGPRVGGVAPMTGGGGGGGGGYPSRPSSSFFHRNQALMQGLDSTTRGLAKHTGTAANSSPHRAAVGGSVILSAPSTGQRPTRHRPQLSGGVFGGLIAPRPHGRFPSRSEMLVQDLLSEEPATGATVASAVVISPPPLPARSAPPCVRTLPDPLDCTAFDTTAPPSLSTPSAGLCDSGSGAHTNARTSWEAPAVADADTPNPATTQP